MIFNQGGNMMKCSFSVVIYLSVNFILLLGNYQSVYAETIVHLDRDSRPREIHTYNQHTKMEIGNDSNNNRITKKQENEEDTTQKIPIDEKVDNISKNDKNINLDNGNKEKVHKIKTLDNYFCDFTQKGPELNAQFGEGGDLAGLSSNASYTSTYTIISHDKKESVCFSIVKMRSASAFFSDTSLYLSAYFNLNIPFIVSDKRPPIIELASESNVRTIKFKKISNYSSNGFSIFSGNVHLLDELYVPNTTVTLLIDTKSGEKLRIPIQQNVITQWQQVTSADLKKVKRGYE